MTAFSPRTAPLRIWISVPVIITLGGVALVLAGGTARSPATPRPAVAVRGESETRPIVASLVVQLEAIAADATTLSQTGSEALDDLEALDVEAARAALGRGDEIAAAIGVAVERVAADRLAAQDGHAPPPRGTDEEPVLDGLDDAIAAAARLRATWGRLAADARDVASIVHGMMRLDRLIDEAMATAGDERWQDALDTLGDARDQITALMALRDAQPGGGETLTDALRRYDTFGDALANLYEYARDFDRQEGTAFGRRIVEVDAARAALPAVDEVLPNIVAEIGGARLGGRLADVEHARLELIEALAATRGGDRP